MSHRVHKELADRADEAAIHCAGAARVRIDQYRHGREHRPPLIR
jgi:hypothetical protein